MAVNSRALRSPPGAHASKRMCQKETLNRLQYPLVLDTGNHNFGIFLVRKYSQTQGQNKTWLKIMKLKLIHPTLALVSNLLFSSLFWYFAVYTIIRLEIYHTSWAGIHNKCARIKYRWRFNYHAAHAFWITVRQHFHKPICITLKLMGCKPLLLEKHTVSCSNLPPETRRLSATLAGPTLHLPLNYKAPQTSKNKYPILFQRQMYAHTASSHFSKTRESKTKPKLTLWLISQPHLYLPLWFFKVVLFYFLIHVSYIL